MMPQKVRAHERWDPRSGTMIQVREHERSHSFRERLADASGGASEDLPFVAGTAAVAVGTCAATVVTAVAYGLAVGAGVCLAVSAVAYKGVKAWAAKRDVHLPDLPTFKRPTDGPIDARKVTERAERRERNKRLVKTAGVRARDLVRTGRAVDAAVLFGVARASGAAYRFIARRVAGRRRVVRGEVAD